MDNVLLFLLLTAFTFLVIFMLFEFVEDKDTTTDDVRERLRRFASKDRSPQHVQHQKRRTMKNYFIDLIEPLAITFHKKTTKPEQEKGMRQLLMECGMPSGQDDVIRFVAFQIFLCTTFTLGSLFLSIFSLKQNILISIILVLLSVMVGYKLPLIRLKGLAKKRGIEIRKNLPDALDLLIVCIEAGLGLDAALTKVSTEQARYANVLSKELGRVSKDILAGIPRQDAFKNLSLRNQSEELKSLVALLIQTDKLGTSIGGSLRVYADTLRTKRRHKAEEMAAKASTKMIFPLVLFILPATFIVLMAPAGISLMKQFGSLK